jgi:sarcosine oxidase subunit delta
MLQIPCPWCGLRDEIEFAPRGEVVTRPDPQLATDREWVAYLFERGNARGWLREYWMHTHGCGQLFVIRRHNVTNDVTADESAITGRAESVMER